MRSTSWARWATCALAISICIPALAERGARSVAECTNFNQVEKGETAVEFTIRNACTIPVDCSISWQVVCAPDAPKRRSRHPGAAKMALQPQSASQTTEANAAICGDDSWAIQGISWSCQPNKD
jgi:hypothetical protein